MTTSPEYLVTARKWRPQQFGEVVGQDHITTTLRNALLSGCIHHAYLFCGPRGVGKTTTARLLARAVNCQSPHDGIEPCNQCESCRDIISGRSIDVVEIDGASTNSVEDIRRLRENAKYPPTTGRSKIYIIDEVHMLTTSAFNALLKILEEPPAHVLFIFATTEPHKVPPTIRSRCQRFDFHRMSTRTIADHLRTIANAEHVPIDDDALFSIARFADGSMRDAQSLFDQVRAFSAGTITGADVRRSLHILGDDVYFAITDAIVERNLARAFDLARLIVGQGYDVHQTLVGLLEHLRNALTVRATGNTELIEASDETRSQYTKLAECFSEEDLVHMMTLVATAEQQLRYASQPEIRLELLLAQLVHLPTAYDIGRLIAALEQLGTQPEHKHSPEIPPPRTTVQSTHTVSSSLQAPATPTQNQTQMSSSPSAETTFGWKAFVDSLPPTLRVLRPILERLPSPIITNDNLIIECSDVNDAKTIEERRPMLEKHLAKKLNRSVRITIIETQASTIQQAAVTKKAATPSDQQLYPIERVLIEKFNAQRIPVVR
jgi:DNA polymerase-3 subunit gamma/tau